MILIKNFWKDTKIRLLHPSNRWMVFWFVVLMVLVSTGCGSKVTVSTAQTAVKVDTELAKIEVIKTGLVAARDSINDNVIRDTEPPPPEPLHLIALDSFLKENNCEIYFGPLGDFEKAKACYYFTVVRLINETNNVDRLGSLLYESEYRNFMYWRTLNGMLDSLGVPETTQKK